MSMRPLVLLLIFTACSSTFGQALSYQDADTPSEAVGMMNTTLVTNRKMLSECVKRFPEQEGEMSRNLRAWEEKEAPAIRRAQYFWSQMAKRDPKMIEFSQYVESIVVKNMENVANAPSGFGNQVLAAVCDKHFSDLASGIWRSRTPKAYIFLDRAPDQK
jgi:hypothetical protein